jgi:hypothetical protein
MPHEPARAKGGDLLTGRPPPLCREAGLAAVRIRVVDAVPARHGFPTAVPALGAGRQVFRRTDVELVATVRAAVRARRYVASCWDWVSHDDVLSLARTVKHPVPLPVPLPDSRSWANQHGPPMRR